MTTVTLSEAEANLSELMEKASHGEPFLIAREGKPSLKVTVSETPPVAPPTPRRLGFLEGKYKVPEDIKGPFREEIEEMFDLKDKFE